MIKNKNKIILTMILLCTLMLNGCNVMNYELGKMKEALKGRTAIVKTYDEESNVIDQIKGESISISSEDKFDATNEKGETIKKSSVISLTIGKNVMTHVGSSLILYEDGLVDIFDKFSKTVDIKNFDRATPFLNRMVNSMKNITTGKSKVVLIRSQSGKPLATFVGNDVSYFATDMDKTTGILIDGKYLFIYRCDYTLYDIDLLQEKIK